MDGGTSLPSGAYADQGTRLLDIIKSHTVEDPGEAGGQPSESLLFEKDECFYGAMGIFISLLAAIWICLLLHDSRIIRKIFIVIPESGCLVITGMVVSSIFFWVFGGTEINLQPPSLDILIIPIILHASYSLFHPHFFGQLGTILILSFVGTLLNVIVITGIIYPVYNYYDNEFNLFHCLTFASVISAVDPVAVLAVFKEVNADRRLHYLIFGESLLNDGVTFVLFEGFDGLTDPKVVVSEVPLKTYAFITSSFITSPLGGVLVGYLVGVISCLHYRWTNHHTSIMIMAALSFTFAHMFNFSGIISLITYGLTQERYTFQNMTARDQINANNIVHGFAVVFESILYLLLGFEMTDHFEDLTTYYVFCLLTLAAILIARALVILLVVNILNCFRSQPIDLRWQSIIFLGGLRGAIAYAMVVNYNNKFKEMFLIATVFIIVVTTLINGVLTKPLVLCLHLKQGDHVDYQDYYRTKKRNLIFRGFQWFERKCILPIIQGAARNAEKRAEKIEDEGMIALDDI